MEEDEDEEEAEEDKEESSIGWLWLVWNVDKVVELFELFEVELSKSRGQSRWRRDWAVGLSNWASDSLRKQRINKSTFGKVVEDNDEDDDDDEGKVKLIKSGFKSIFPDLFSLFFCTKEKEEEDWTSKAKEKIK